MKKEYINENEINEKAIAIGVITAILVIITIITIFSSFKTVNSGEVGIRVRFGKVISTQMNEGINFKIPFVENIVKMNIQVQKVEVATESSSKDLQLVNMQIAVNYRVDGTKATELYKNIGMKYKEVVLQPAIQESIKSVTSRYTAEELITKRNEVSINAMEELNNKINKYGIVIDNFNITNFNFSAEFNKAIEQKKVAEQNVLTAKQQLEKSKVEAEKKIVEAEAEKKANELKQKSLTDKLIQEKFIQKWDGKLPYVISDGFILDISSLIK